MSIYFIPVHAHHYPLSIFTPPPNMAPLLNKKTKGLVAKAASSVVQEAIKERDDIVSKPGSRKVKDKDEDIVEELIRAAALGVGFISEAVQYRKEKKRVKEEAGTSSSVIPEKTSTSPSSSLVELPATEVSTVEAQNYDAVWQLDERETAAAAQQDDTPTASEKSKPPADLAVAFVKRHPVQLDADPSTRIALPVILPQRRPKSRARGFVRAYAPVLADVGIDQATFLDFMDTFNKVAEPNQWIYAINLAGLAGLSMPAEPIMMLVDVAAHVITETIMEVQSRFKSNKFLDHLNAEFFAPRGLLCFVATWKPDAVEGEELITTVNLEGKQAGDSIPTMTDMLKGITSKKTSKDEMKRFHRQMETILRPSDGTTTGVEWPEPAPLVFPSVNPGTVATMSTTAEEESGDDSKGESNTSKDAKKKKKKNGATRAGDWIDEYMDKHAQARWIDENPDAPVANALPRPEFRSRYADPSHAATSGDVVALLSGGRWQYGSKEKVAREEGKRERKREKSVERVERKKREKQSSSKKKEEKKKSTIGLTNLLQSVSSLRLDRDIGKRLC